MKCVSCVCVSPGTGWEMRGLGLGFNIPVGKGGVWDVCIVFGLWRCGVGRAWEGGVVLCVCVVSLDYLC